MKRVLVIVGACFLLLLGLGLFIQVFKSGAPVPSDWAVPSETELAWHNGAPSAPAVTDGDTLRGGNAGNPPGTKVPVSAEFPLDLPLPGSGLPGATGSGSARTSGMMGSSSPPSPTAIPSSPPKPPPEDLSGDEPDIHSPVPDPEARPAESTPTTPAAGEPRKSAPRGDVPLPVERAAYSQQLGYPPPRPAADRPSTDEAKRRLEDRLQLANIAYNDPRHMTLDDTVTVQLKISPHLTKDQLKRQISEPGKIESASIRIAQRMEAHLTGSGFEIKPIGSTLPQEIDPSGVNEWAWEVTATSPGKHRLHLAINAVVQVEGGDASYLQRTFDRTIVVDVTLGQKVESFVQMNWPWVWTVLLVPVLGFAASRVRRKRASGWDPKRLSKYRLGQPGSVFDRIGSAPADEQAGGPDRDAGPADRPGSP